MRGEREEKRRGPDFLQVDDSPWVPTNCMGACEGRHHPALNKRRIFLPDVFFFSLGRTGPLSLGSPDGMAS